MKITTKIKKKGREGGQKHVSLYVSLVTSYIQYVPLYIYR
jgi:hypothetical protein